MSEPTRGPSKQMFAPERRPSRARSRNSGSGAAQQWLSQWFPSPSSECKSASDRYSIQGWFFPQAYSRSLRGRSTLHQRFHSQAVHRLRPMEVLSGSSQGGTSRARAAFLSC
eukprot:g48376.t1